MSPRDQELMEGIGNCYEACHGSFEETLAMVSGYRHRDEAEVLETLRRLARGSGEDPEYIRLRARVPKEFPF